MSEFDDDAPSREIPRDLPAIKAPPSGLKSKDLLARSKVRSRVLPRQVAMFIARRLTQLSLQEIGMHFGGRDHTTDLYAEDRIEKLLRR